MENLGESEYRTEWVGRRRAERLRRARLIQSPDDLLFRIHNIGIVIHHQYIGIVKSFDAHADFPRVPNVVLIAKTDQLRLAEESGTHKGSAVTNPISILVNSHPKRRRTSKIFDDRQRL